METSRHKCLLYEGAPSGQLPVVVPMLAESLSDGLRCLYLGDTDSVRMLEDALRRDGLDVAGHASRGALVFSSDRSHLAAGRFDPKSMVGMLRGLVEDSLRDGFKGLCATGDMRWELGDDGNLEALLEYEARLEQVFMELPLRGICQYRLDALPKRAVRDALMTHRAAFLGERLHADNHFFVPPELLLEDPGAAARDSQGDWMWRQISRISEAERARDAALAALARLNAELESRVKERTAELEAFGYTISHDLRAPLRSIEGFTQTILRRHVKDFGEDDRVDFRFVTDGCKRLSAMLDGLLTLSRLGRQELRAGDVDLTDAARRVADELNGLDASRKVEFSAQEGLSARGDAALLFDLLHNLIGNAWKFTGRTAQARVEVGVETGGGERAFFVRDNGGGFDMKHAGRLFKPFERLHSAREFPGTGVGLATSRRIVERHGGRIWARSAPGAGTTVYFTLPG